MSEFKNVTISRKANFYFDGKVVSYPVTFPDGAKKTIGAMQPGEYEFGTQQTELMEIDAGEMHVLLPGESEWKIITAGQSFHVGANVSFQVKIVETVSYCCTYGV